MIDVALISAIVLAIGAVLALLFLPGRAEGGGLGQAGRRLGGGSQGAGPGKSGKLDDPVRGGMS
jgi:hypothetical protein